MKKYFSRLCALAALFLILSGAIAAQDWTTVRSESRFNFSGMALVEQTDERKTFVVVHDNKDQLADAAANPKKNKTERAGLLIVEKGALRPRYEALNWEFENGKGAALPVDLESICAVPGQPNRFLALVGNPNEAAEKGKIYYLELVRERRAIRVLASFKLPIPTDGRDFEGIGAHDFGGSRLLMFWADRGKNREPATVWAGDLDLNKSTLNVISTVSVKTPAPDTADFTGYKTVESRSISDLKVIASGALFVTSTLDGEDDGPFASAFYYIGVFSLQNNGIVFKYAADPVKLFAVKNYKIEAFDFVPGKNGGLIFGTDDEDFGASVRFDW